MLGRILHLHRRHVDVAELLLRARAHPAGDHRRRRVLDEAGGATAGEVFDEGAALLRSGDPESVALGAELLEVLVTGHDKGRRFVPVLARLLDGICGPAQHPVVLVAALPLYLAVRDDCAPVLLELLDHPDGGVRRAAAAVVAVRPDVPCDRRTVSLLVRLLDDDPEPTVRTEAAAALARLHQLDERHRPGIEEVLAEYEDDPLPGVRVAALKVLAATAPGQALAALAAELAVADPDWRFVAACADASRWTDPGDLHRELLRLQERGWAEHDVSPARFPPADERAALLTAALTALSEKRRYEYERKVDAC
ncbi:HEAT repeat domain-containing protein [Kitasatospora sp. NPDC052896]|uniref:HEAT repeat domain-containing protein n=1 Tax=Kitasatospora sp. NPDC052896 TaxID=3364061 RepID=UPI0037C50F54